MSTIGAAKAARTTQTEAPVNGALAQLCKALADPLRLDILRLLRTESFGVLEISRITDVRQSALSHHLKVLATAGLVSTRREGNSIFYRRALLLGEDPYLAIKRAAFNTIDSLALSEDLAAGIRQVQRERSEQSLEYFARNVERFRENQELVSPYEQYEDTLHTLLDDLHLPRASQVLEVGPGEGALLGQLAQRFDTVTALDNSLDMLNRARASIVAQGLDNVVFIHGDTTVAVRKKLRCDLLVCNMVLHHIPSPADALNDCAQLLQPGARMLLIDLSRHDQDWVRQACGDLWLGFDTEDLDVWAAQAGLTSAQSMYLGLRNGFQIQIRIFIKPEQE